MIVSVVHSVATRIFTFFGAPNLVILIPISKYSIIVDDMITLTSILFHRKFN
jgi:hypothetical protein